MKVRAPGVTTEVAEAAEEERARNNVDAAVPPKLREPAVALPTAEAEGRPLGKERRVATTAVVA